MTNPAQSNSAFLTTDAQLPVVQYWHADEIPGYIAEMLATFAEQNPNCPHLVFSEASAERFIDEHFGTRELSAFRACAVPAMQADYFRYCAGLVFGGICSDADYYCARSFGPLFDEAEKGLLFQTPNGTVHNGFFVFTAPGHPLLRLAVDVATANIERRCWEQVWWTTGPGVFTVLWELYRHGSFEEARRGAAEHGLESHVARFFPPIGEYSRVAEAFVGVRIKPFDLAREWLSKPQAPLPYKETALHWSNWQEEGWTIFR